MKSDLKEAWRTLAAQPGFSLVVVLTLALAIGINSAIFSVVNGVLLRPLDYADPGRLVVLWESNPAAGQPQSETSGATYLDWRTRTRTFSSIGAFRYRGFTLTGAGEPEHIASVEASPALFRVLGVPPLLGRVFTDEEELPGHERLAILSYGAWQRRFGGRAGRRGQTLQLDGQTFEVVGVMPKTFQFPPGDPRRRGVVAAHARRAVAPDAAASDVSGDRPTGAGRDDALRRSSDMDAHRPRPRARAPRHQRGWGVRLVPAHEQVVGDIGRTLWVLFGAVVLVLLIACANIANLLLARSARAARDFAIRAALGAAAACWCAGRSSRAGCLSGSGAVVGPGARVGRRRVRCVD